MFGRIYYRDYSRAAANTVIQGKMNLHFMCGALKITEISVCADTQPE